MDNVLDGRVVEFSPPQSELDSNIRNLLSHLVRELKTITFPLVALPDNGYVMWDVASRPDGTNEITIWWAEEPNVER